MQSRTDRFKPPERIPAFMKAKKFLVSYIVHPVYKKTEFVNSPHRFVLFTKTG